jgi:acyl dehydratase
MIDVARIAVGDELALWEREGTFQHWNRFAAVNYEFGDHHMDDEVGRHEGFDGAFMMAPLQHAFLHALLREWMEGQGRIVSVKMRLRSPLLRGRTLRASGTVIAVRHQEDEVFVDLDLDEVDDAGTAIGPGSATVAFPAPATT